MMQWSEIVLVLQLAVGMVFLYSCWTKIFNPTAFFVGIRAYRILPTRAVHVSGGLIIGAELIIAFSHLGGHYLDVVALLAIGMLAAFLVAIVTVLGRGDLVPCQCFGSGDDEYVSAESAARVLVLMLVETIIWIFGLSESESLTLFDLDTISATLLMLMAILSIIALYWVFKLPKLFWLFKQARPMRGVWNGMREV